MDADARELEERLVAVERALIENSGGDGGHEGDAGDRSAAGVGADHADVEERLDALEARVDELDAAVQAVRGYVGGVDAVGERVERRANLALAKAERLESERGDEAGLSVERLPEGGGGDADGGDPADEPAWTPEGGERTLADRLRDAL